MERKQPSIHPITKLPPFLSQTSKTTPLGLPTFGGVYVNRSLPLPIPIPVLVPTPCPFLDANLSSHPIPVFNAKKPTNAPHAVSHELPVGANISPPLALMLLSLLLSLLLLWMVGELYLA